MKRRAHIIILMAVLFVFVGCAQYLSGVSVETMASKGWSNMTPQERSIMFLHAYNSQYRDYLEMADMTDLTEVQKTIMRAKKSVLKEVYPLIGVYIEVVEAGGVVSQDLENQILKLLNSIGSRLGD